jgi:hypothetical protein
MGFHNLGPAYIMVEGEDCHIVACVPGRSTLWTMISSQHSRIGEDDRTRLLKTVMPGFLR